MRHVKFLARTVLVANNNIEEACRVLNRILGKEDIFDQFRRTRFYEKPYQVSLIRSLLSHKFYCYTRSHYSCSMQCKYKHSILGPSTSKF